MPRSTSIASSFGRAWPTSWRYGVAIMWWFGILAIYVFAASMGESPASWAIVADLLLGALAIWAMRFRHRWPRGLVVVTLVVGIFSISGAVAMVWAIAHLATRRRWPEIVALGGLHVVVSGLLSRVHFPWLPDPGATSWRDVLISVIGSAVIVALVTAIGSYVGARRDLIKALHERAEVAEQQQELRVLQGQAEERNRIAREMHDVLAHRISLVSMHAGILAYREDLGPEQVREVAAVIQDNARQSMTELRTILGSLRQDDDETSAQPDAPQPGFDDIAGLFADARLAGQRLEVTMDIKHPELLPTLVGRHCYRVVQELVTNARKHAPHARIRIEVTGAPGEGIRLSSGNPIQPGTPQLPGSGVGLIGLRERAAVLGGSMTSGLDDEGWFTVKVWFPW